MRATDLNWDDVFGFSYEEWNNATANHNKEYGLSLDSVLDHIDARWVLNASALRKDWGKSIFVSPVAGAWVRHYGSERSTHYVGRDYDECLAIGGDVFPKGQKEELGGFMRAARKYYSGIGVYMDTSGPNETGIMFHLDNRPFTERLEWVRVDGEYYYPANGGKSKEMFDRVMEEIKA